MKVCWRTLAPPKTLTPAQRPIAFIVSQIYKNLLQCVASHEVLISGSHKRRRRIFFSGTSRVPLRSKYVKINWVASSNVSIFWQRFGYIASLSFVTKRHVTKASAGCAEGDPVFSVASVTWGAHLDMRALVKRILRTEQQNCRLRIRRRRNFSRLIFRFLIVQSYRDLIIAIILLWLHFDRERITNS